MARLNDMTVRALRTAEGEDRKEVWFDEKGLGMRVSKTGRKSWVYVYHYAGKSRRMTFGIYPSIGVADVRVLHAAAVKDVTEGRDPGSAVQAERLAQNQAITVQGLADEYLRLHAVKKRSGQEDRRMLLRDVLPAWGSVKANEIARRDVIRLLDQVVERGAPIAANRVLALVRKMFNFGIERSLIDANPCDRVKPPSARVVRERTLSLEEIRAFWHGLASSKMAEEIKLALKFQLVTAQRKGEIAKAEWSEVDFESRTWTISADKAKNGRAHRVPLSELAMSILMQIRKLSEESKYWMPSRSGDKPMLETAIDHALRRNLSALNLEDVTPHDLRRTAATMMSSLGVQRITLSRILNHTDSSVTAVYDRHSYDQEKRAALDLWAAQLGGILDSKRLAT